MHYISTNGRSPAATFREAVLAGQPDDRWDARNLLPADLPLGDRHAGPDIDDPTVTRIGRALVPGGMGNGTPLPVGLVPIAKRGQEPSL